VARSEHQNKAIEAAICYAESLQWRCEKSGPRAHAWGKLYCPQADRTGCIVFIYGTPRNPENHAKRIMREIDECPH
jgi:hypothetical protein